MSAKMCGLVWDLDLPREEKYVLLCLADHADHDGNDVFPSVGLISWKTDYSERRVQQLMRRLERRGLLVKVEEQFGRGRTMKYRIDMQAGRLRERRRKGARISPITRESEFGKGEIPQGERVKSDALKGEIAIAPESIESKAIAKQIPPTPLFKGGISTNSNPTSKSSPRDESEIWRIVCGYLKDDLSNAFVKTARFEECAYDTYFRDAWLVEIKNDVASLDSNEPELLLEGVEKFQKRLRETFRGVVYSIRSIRVKLRDRNADSANQSSEACSQRFEKWEPESGIAHS